MQRLGASTVFPMMPLFPAGSVNVSYTPVDRRPRSITYPQQMKVIVAY